MKRQFLYRFVKNPVFIGLFIFSALLFLTQYLSYQRYLLLKEVEQREISNEANHAKEGLQNVVNYSFSTTQTLAFIVENYGVPNNFDSVANQLLKVNSFIDMVELVQGGVITHVYPLSGNESVIGFNILLDSARKSGALAAIMRRDFFIAGPIHLKQGGAGFVSRVPIFKNNKFWGFSAAVVKLSTLLYAAGIDTASNQRFTFQIAKVNAETGKEEFFLPLRKPFGKSLQVLVEIPNGEWRLYVTDEKSITFSSIFIYMLLGFVLSVTGGFFAWYIAVQPSRLNKLVEEKTFLLKESELKYKNTLERITDGFAALDNNGCCNYMNKMAGELLKRDPEKMIGIQLLKEFPEEMSHTFYAAYTQAKGEQKHIYAEAYFPSLDSWFETDIYPAKNGTSLFFRDITQKKKADEELRQANNRFEMISRTTNDAVWEWELETGQLWSNETHQHLYGLTLSDPVPTNEMWAERIHPADREAILKKQEVTLASNENIFITEYRFLTEEKGYRNLFDRCYIMRNEEGKATGLMGSIMDITERKQSELELQKALDRYHILSKATSDTIWDWDMKSQMMSYNEGVTTMLGYKKTEAESIPDWWKLNLHPDDLVHINETLYESFLKNKQTIQLSYRFRCADGSYKYIFDRAFVLYDEEGQPIRIIGAMQDVTYEKEEEIRITKAIVTAQEAERQQLGMELHDNVNQILSVALLYLGMAKQQQENSEDFSLTIGTCKKHITDAIYEIRKLSHQLAPVSKDDVSFKDVFETLIDSLTGNCTIAVALHFDDFEMERISYNIQTALYRILQEQMNNILKHSDAEIVDIWVTVTDGIIMLRMADDGKGFDLKKVNKGIGLRNIKRRAEMYGGKFICNSSPGEGCEIIVRIPLEENN